MKINDGFTPYDLACFMAMQGLLAGKPEMAHYQYELAEDVIRVVDALVARIDLAKQKQEL
jgi:hypothetical protein